AAAKGGQVGVLFIDLDGFKQVNDTLGHDAGDGLIVAVAGMLRRSVLGADLVGRLGGDEFAVVLAGIESTDKAISVAKRILAEMAHPVRLAGEDVYAQASIGVGGGGARAVGTARLVRSPAIAPVSGKGGAGHRCPG